MIVAVDKNFGIGINNKLPWDFSKDMIYFKDKTIGNKKNAIIMGRKTYDSIGKALPNRSNYVLSKSLNAKQLNNVTLLNDPEKVLDLFQYDEIWIIGGSSIYDYFLSNHSDKIDKIFLTKIHQNYNCDAFFPKIPNTFYKSVNKIALDHDKKNNNAKELLTFQVYKS